MTVVQREILFIFLFSLRLRSPNKRKMRQKWDIFTSRAAAESNSSVGGRCSSADVCLIGFIGVKVSPVGVVLQQTFVS